nr:hypothetical protein B0547.3 - Caenorhabditis elegans [Caenorhabditis elegans]
MVDFSVIFSYTHGIIAICGMLFNVLLAYLALFQTPRVIQSYSTLIVNFAITDFFACLFDFFVQQRLIPSGLTLAYISNGLCSHFGPTTCYVGYSLMLHCLSHSLWSLLLSFSYRCYILYKPAPTRHVLVILIFLIYTPSLFQFVSFLWAQDEPTEIREILTESFSTYNLTGYTVTGTKNIICFSALFTILHMTLPITPVYICILVLRRRIISRLSFKGVNITKDTKNLHSQLLMALTYQAAIPGFYLFGLLTFSSFLFIPLLSPLASFIFVTPYRHFINHAFFKMAHVEPAESSSTPHNYTSHIHVIG